MDLRISDVICDSIVDGPGLSMTVFLQGCTHNCKGCHNPSTHKLDGGRIVDTDYILEMFFKNPLLDGITFSGGEPLLQPKPVSAIAKAVKEKGFNVIVYTGFVWEKLMEDLNSFEKVLKYTDILIDGPFIESLKSYDLDFRGSSNQRAIDVSKSLLSGAVNLYEF